MRAPFPLLALALLALAGAAEAQRLPSPFALPTATEVLVPPPEGPLQPLGRHTVVPVVVRYTYPEAAVAIAPTAIELRVAEAPPWLVATLSPGVVYVPVDPLDHVPTGASMTRLARAALLLTATTDAPAFAPARIEVEAHARSNGNLASSEGHASVPIQAGFLGLLGAAMPYEVALRGERPVEVPMTVTAFGNALAQVGFEVMWAPEGIDVTPPGPIVLEAPPAGGNVTGQAVWVLRARGAFEEGNATLRARSAYNIDPRIGGGTADVVVRVTKAPGLDVQLLGEKGDDTALALQTGALSALGALAWALQRRGV